MGRQADKLRKSVERHVRSIEEKVRRATYLVVETLVATTPVDTGAARSNWLVSIGQPRTDDVSPRPPADTLAEAKAAIWPWRKGQKVYIVNNLPYIVRLNNGWSAQAPAGFVEMAFAKANRSLAQK